MGANLFTRPNLKVHKKILKISFEKYGDPDLMSHCMLHALPIRTAIKFNIPLVFLGENSALEYSGDTRYDLKKLPLSGLKNMLQITIIRPKSSKRHKIPYPQLKMYDLPSNKKYLKQRQFFAVISLNGILRII